MIEVVNLSKLFCSYNENIIALNKINCKIEDKESIVIIGPSGSGKSTFIKIIIGLMKPTDGYIKIDNLRLVKQNEIDEWRLNQVSYVPQYIKSIPHLKIRDLFKIAIAQNKKRNFSLDLENRKLLYLLNELELKTILNQYPVQLSGGELQRFEIVKALIKMPKYLILDEPTSALDYTLAYKLVDIIGNQVEKSGSTLILATHDTRITKLCKTKFKLDNGILRRL